MKKFLLLIAFLLNFVFISSQKKDTIFIILQDDVYAKAINDTLVIDKNVGWINQNKIGTYLYPEKDQGWCDVGSRKDTILLGEKIIEGRYMINKYFYSADIDYQKSKLINYIKTIDSCDKIYRLESEKDIKLFQKNRQLENKNRKEIYKCYHQNLKEKTINLTPYSFWREDSKSDSTVIFETVISAKKEITIKSDSRIYKNLEEIEKICKLKNRSDIKCFRFSRDTFSLMGLDEFKDLDLKKYYIYINEDFIPEDFYNIKAGKTKMIMLNEYHFKKNYHKYR